MKIPPIVIRSQSQADYAIKMIQNNWQAMAVTGDNMEVRIGKHKDTRTLRDNAHMHWLFTRIAEQAWVNNRQYGMETWKEFLKRKFLPVIELPSGETMAHPTHKLDYEAAQVFIREVEAYAVSELGVIFPEYRDN